eukprot:3928341-Prymnesium_polylepis.1
MLQLLELRAQLRDQIVELRLQHRPRAAPFPLFPAPPPNRSLIGTGSEILTLTRRFCLGGLGD